MAGNKLGLPPGFVLDTEPQYPIPTAVAAPLEAMQAFNNAAYGLVDLVGIDTVNSILKVAGSDARIPRITDQPLMNQQFMDEGLGRDTAQAVGEVAALGLGAGSALRAGAQQLPKLASGAESVGAGVLRQMGQSTAGQDLTTGALAGLGQELGGEVGENVAGAEGRMAGEMLGSMTAPLAGVRTKTSIESSRAAKRLKEAAPGIDDFKDAAGPLYDKIDSLDVKVKQESLGRLSDNIAKTVKDEGYSPLMAPKVKGALREIDTMTQAPLSVKEIDTMRKVARSAAQSIEPSEARLGSMMVNKIDDFVDDLPPTDLTRPDENVGPILKEARGLWSKAKKLEIIEEAVAKADLQSSGLENGLRVQFRSILNNKKTMKGFTEAEKQAMKKVVKGGKAENIARALGKFGFTQGQASSMLMGSLGVAGGSAVGGTFGAVAVPLAGQSFKSLAQSLTRNNARLAQEVIAAGPDGKKIAKAYMSAVPKKQRKTEELTALLLNQKASLSPIRNSDDKLVADAAYFASVASVPAGKLAE